MAARLEIGGETNVDALVAEYRHVVDLGIVLLGHVYGQGPKPRIHEMFSDPLFAEFLIHSVGVKDQLRLTPLPEIPTEGQVDRTAEGSPVLDGRDELFLQLVVDQSRLVLARSRRDIEQ